ncbi:hypothetical protein O0L34_g16441 [Tuta absoluta]|nr:hypothetical protein O0L34_g16441 [Tuta absoluta]
MFLLTVVGVLAAIVVFLWKYRKLNQVSNQLKHGIKSYPFFGISYQFFGNCEVHMRAIKKIGRETVKQGGIIAAWFGPQLYISIADPVLAEIVLKTCLEKDDITKFTRYASGTGSIFAPVSIWRTRRKAVMPIFSSKNLMNYVNVFGRQSEILMEQLNNIPDRKCVEMWSYLFAYAADSVSETTLGVELHMQKNHDHPFMKNLSEGTKLIAARTCQPWLHSDLVYKLLPSYKRFRNALDFSRNFINEVIISKSKPNKPNQPSTAKNPKSLLEMLLDPLNSQRLSNLELIDEMLTFFVAGTETTAVTIGFTLLMLAKYPVVQDKIEISHKPINQTYVSSDDLPQLKYLDVVIKETMRLYPPGVVVLRKIDKYVTLPTSTPVTLPPGCGCVIHIWALHRNPDYWGPDADEFRPNRFLDKPETLKHPAQYMPFSYGPRSCIGHQFATLSIKTALATLLLRYRVLPSKDIGGPSDLKLKFDFLLKDVNNFCVRLERRLD